MRRITHSPVLAALLLPALLSLTACTSGLRVKEIDAAQERPANVLLFFRVTGGGLAAVPGLQESAFEVKEDDHVVGPGVDRVIVNPDLRSTQSTMLLVDLGGRPTAEELDALATAAGALVDRLGANRRVALYALDGAETPFALAPFGASQEALKAGAAKIPTYKTRDPSLDLNGGYVAALHLLKQAAPQGAGPRIGNVVLLVRGPDRASRLDLHGVSVEARKTDVDIRRFAVFYGADTEKVKLDPFADDAVVRVASPTALIDAVDKIADTIDERGKSFYLLSYCTPARGGQHRVRIDVARERSDENGHVTVDHGSVAYAFRADGFGPGCTPGVPDGWKGGDHPPAVITGAKVNAARGNGAKPSLAGAIPAP